MSLIILDWLTASKNHTRFVFDLSDDNTQLIVQFKICSNKICLKFYMQSTEIALEY